MFCHRPLAFPLVMNTPKPPLTTRPRRRCLERNNELPGAGCPGGGAGRVGEQFLWETTVLRVHFCYNCTKTIKFINHLNDKHGVSLLLSSGQVEPAAIALAGFRGSLVPPTETS